jgi:hypothetical protein
MMRKFIIPVFWTMSNDLEIEAETLDEAIIKAREWTNIPEQGSEYVADSYTVNTECAEMLNDPSPGNTKDSRQILRTIYRYSEDVLMQMTDEQCEEEVSANQMYPENW